MGRCILLKDSQCGWRTLGLTLLRKQQGVIALEYLLIVAVVVVAMAAAIIAGVANMVPQIVGYVCPAADTAYDGNSGPVFPYPAAPVFAEPVPAIAPAATGDCLGDVPPP